MSADCEIKFENCPSNVVFAGQEVAGTVDINVDDVVKVRKLTLYIEGIEECKWKESFGFGLHTQRYQGRDKYVIITDLIPDETEIQPGNHLYNFNFQVPEGAPSSVRERHGSVYYRVRVVFDRPWKIDFEFKKDFVVVKNLDLNLNPLYKTPVQQEKISKVDFLFYESQPVTLTVSIPKNGFVKLEKIPIKVVINNLSDTKINHVEITLMKNIEYSSQTPRSRMKLEKVKISSMHHECLPTKRKQEFDIEIDVPETVTPSSSSLATSVITIRYVLIVKAKILSKFHKSPEIVFPITIGTVPLVASDSAKPINNYHESMIST